MSSEFQVKTPDRRLHQADKAQGIEPGPLIIRHHSQLSLPLSTSS
jgi:hypothetical protein